MEKRRFEPDMNSDPNRQYRFKDFVINESRGALLCGEVEVPLRKQAYDMLVLLVEHQGELVTKDFLMDTIWGNSVVTENSITQCLKEIRHAIGDDDLTMIRTIPRRGYIFELAVERLDTGAEAPPASATQRARVLLAAVVLVGLAVLAWWALDRSPRAKIQSSVDATSSPPNSLAVLPFVNMSPDPDISFLADGVSEEILNHLAQIPELLVIARTSSFTFRDQDVDIATIGHELNVAHVLEGSVRVEDGTARVTAQLVRTDSQAHLWSRSYDRPLDNIFELQKGIARDVAQQLQVKLTDGAGKGAHSVRKPKPDAYEAYLRGKYLMAQRTSRSVATAADEFRKAIEHDPEFAAAHAGLALATRFQSETLYGSLSKSESLAGARQHAERALELDPELAEAHAAMGYALVSWETMDRALHHFRQAVALNPNYAEGAMWLGGFLLQKGEYRESNELLARAVRADPLSKTALWNYTQYLMDVGLLDDAGQELEKLASLWPSGHRVLMARLRSLNGQWAEGALAALEARLEYPDDWALTKIFEVFLAAMGLGESALDSTPLSHPLFFELRGRPQEIVREYENLQTETGLRTAQEWVLGEALAATGDFARALPYLEANWESVEGVVAMPWFGGNRVLALIEARRAMNEPHDNGALVAAMQDNVRRYREAGLVMCELLECIDFETGIAAYLAGDRPTAVTLLTRAVTNGYLIPPDLAYLRILYDDPDLVPVFERQQAHVIREREEFLRSICADNPYSDVWQPLEGTCMAYLSDGASKGRQREPGR